MRHKILYASSQSASHNCDAVSQSTMNKTLRGREGGREAGREGGRKGGREEGRERGRDGRVSIVGTHIT